MSRFLRNTVVILGSILIFASPRTSDGQGTFVFDQQSADENTFGESAHSIQPSQPMGQSFTPGLPGVDFIRFFTSDSSVNGLGATLYVNLRSGSITGPIMSSTTPVFLPDGFTGRTNFVFPSQVALTVGDTYYLQPVVQSGDLWQVMAGHFNYTGGAEFGNGLPSPNFDLWFREGIVIPEPRALNLALAGLCGVLLEMRRLRGATGRVFRRGH